MADPKTVLFNDLTLYRPKTGVGCYAAELLRHCESMQSDVKIVRLSQTLAGAPLRWASRLISSAGGGGESNPSRSKRWLQSSKTSIKQVLQTSLHRYLSQACRIRQWPLYHEPDAIPLEIDAPTVTTVHDLSVLLFPEWHPEHRVRKYERQFAAGIGRTTLFLANSQTTKTALVERMGIDAERVVVSLLAPRPQFRVLPENEIREVRQRLGLPEQYLLTIGTIEPRKNIVGLLKAYGSLAPELRQQFPLLLAGTWGWQSDEVREMLTRTPWCESVRWLGYVSDEDLVAVTNAATVMVYPSFHEGFGLPPLEAMACGVPVITTHAGSLAEVVSDAAYIVEPNDIEAIAEAIRLMLQNPELRSETIARGNQHLLNFSWRKTAEATLSGYQKAA